MATQMSKKVRKQLTEKLVLHLHDAMQKNRAAVMDFEINKYALRPDMCNPEIQRNITMTVCPRTYLRLSVSHDDVCSVGMDGLMKLLNTKQDYKDATELIDAVFSQGRQYRECYPEKAGGA